MRPGTRKWCKLGGLLALAGAAVWTAVACQPNGSAGPGLFGSGGNKERWTIRCARLESANHGEMANMLGGLLGKVDGLSSRDVRISSTATTSVIYYGEYTKVPDRDGMLVFPRKYQDDIELIRRLSFRGQTPFFFAGPELISAAAGADAASVEGHVSTAKGTHSLQIAFFYNTSDFNQRKEAAEAYVQDLRRRGFAAYYYHETLRSFVFVGDFDKSDLVPDAGGTYHFGPRVQEFIARNPDEFSYLTENGMKVTHRLPNGRSIPNQSILASLPGRSSFDTRSPNTDRLPGEER